MHHAVRRPSLLPATLLGAAACCTLLGLATPADAARPKPAPKPDLSARILPPTRTTVIAGDAFSVALKVQRTMPSAAVGATRARLVVSTDKLAGRGDTLLGTAQVAAFGGRSTVTLSPKVTWPEVGHGVRYIIACVDDAKRVAEANERNNCASHRVTVKPTLPTVSIVAARPGSEGSAEAPGFVEVDISFDRAYPEPVTVKTVASGGIMRTELVVPAEQTTGTIRVPLKPGDAETEADDEVLVRLGTSPQYVQGTAQSIRTTVLDDDPASASAVRTDSDSVKITFSGRIDNFTSGGTQFSVTDMNFDGARKGGTTTVTLNVLEDWEPGVTYTINVAADLRIGTRPAPATITFVG